MAVNEPLRAGDVIIREQDEERSREDLIVLANETFVLGQVGALDNAGKVVTVATANDEVYTVTEAAGTDAGSFALRYRGLEIAAEAFDVTSADLQTALRALHNDLDACVVTGATGGPYVITVTHEKKSNLFHISKGLDSTNDGGVFEGGIIVNRTTLAEQIAVICLDPATESSDATRAFLVRDAIVDVANLTGSDSDIVKRLAEYKVADDFENQAAFGGILVRTGPTFTTL